MNHYADPTHLSKLLKLADRFFAAYGTPLTFNDTSLQMGGLFDVGTAAWFYPHKAHREGRNTDIRTNGLDQYKLDFIDTQWRNLHGHVVDETETSQPHYHLVSF
jgi:hypothetical protein